MGRMHSRGKGISASTLPYKRIPPNWLKISSQDVAESLMVMNIPGCYNLTALSSHHALEKLILMTGFATVTVSFVRESEDFAAKARASHTPGASIL